MWGSPLLFLVIFSAISCIWFAYHELRRLFYLFKPLTMVLICLTAILGRAGGYSPANHNYQHPLFS